jgi:uncharacterized membrane protein SpoIIM required for sporulation
MDFINFLWIGFPALVRKNIVYVALSFTMVMCPLLISFAMTLQDRNYPQLETVPHQPLVSEELRDFIEHKQLWTDGVERMSTPMSGMIATNNIKVTILAFVLGITFGAGTAYILITNGLSIGAIVGYCQVCGMVDKILAFMAPHGVIELSAIFISGGAGLMIGKALLFPGQYSRVDALKLAAREAGGMFAGCVPMLLIAGSIEAFISPRTDLDSNIKFTVSLATLICLFLYLFVPRHKKSSRQADFWA